MIVYWPQRRDLSGDPILELDPLSFVQGIFVHIVDLDEVTIFTKLKEVSVVVPEVWIITIFASVAGDFVEDAKVFNVFFRLELLNYRFNHLSLIVGHLALILTVC